MCKYSSELGQVGEVPERGQVHVRAGEQLHVLELFEVLLVLCRQLAVEGVVVQDERVELPCEIGVVLHPRGLWARHLHWRAPRSHP